LLQNLIALKRSDKAHAPDAPQRGAKMHDFANNAGVNRKHIKLCAISLP